MTKHTIETVTFKLNKGVSREVFVEAAQAISVFASNRDGFISRRLSSSKIILEPRPLAKLGCACNFGPNWPDDARHWRRVNSRVRRDDVGHWY